MEFNLDNGEFIFYVRSNKNVFYYLSGEKHQAALVQRDIGFLAHESQKTSMQILRGIRKSNGILAFISSGKENQSTKVLLQLNSTLVRPHLEYCTQFRSSYLRPDANALKSVKRKFTRFIPEMKELNHEGRLSSSSLC